jgi:hypothetical protein
VVTRHGDGLVTVRAERVPAQWLIDTLAESAPASAERGTQAQATPATTSTTTPPALASTSAPAAQHDIDLGRELAHPDAERRSAALTAATALGRIVPPERLQALIDNDPADDVRMQAFTTYIDHLASSDSVALRNALRRALQMGSPPLQVAALERLAALDAFELAQAASGALQPGSD